MNIVDRIRRVTTLEQRVRVLCDELQAAREELDVLTVARSTALEPIVAPELPASLRGGLHVSGYAARWEATPNGMECAPGDFAAGLPAFLAGAPIITLSHDTAQTLGRVVDAWEDADGLFVQAIVLPPVEDWQETVVAALAEGLITGMSYVSTRPRDAPYNTLHEVCVTTTPAHPAARIVSVVPL